ncbi:glycosyl transferase family 90-domain-containing protein [Mycena epipterygia]|nr:glycosyl transferase family 90-domain-containing protein [Mycena epipterygia]
MSISTWFPRVPPLFKPTHTPVRFNEDSHPLLPTDGSISLGDDDRDEPDVRYPKGGRWISWPPKLKPPPWYILVALAGVCGLLWAAFSFFTREPQYDPPNEPDLYDHNSTAHMRIDALYARQSSTLAQAMARYSLRNNRPPPPKYDAWYRFARSHNCLIDEYDQIARDFEPFYQLAKDDPAYFKKMVDMGTEKVKKDGRGMTTARFSRRNFKFTDGQWTLYGGDWPRTFGRFRDFMPDMNIILNGRDEPRILFDYRQPQPNELQKLKALNVSDPTPFEHSPKPTAAFFKDDMHCLIPNRPTGFTGLANDASAFMLYSSSTQFTMDLYPVLSMTKISPCFADILVPSEFYYSDSGWTPRYGYPNNIDWDAKKSQLYWRGMSSGGWVNGDNYHAFPRFRVVEIGRSHPDLMDVAISGLHDDLCGEGCDGDAIKAEYGITGASSPREDVYKYKYLFDADGNSFSGRYLGLLRSGSLVFKTTVFTEYFNDWIRPFEHYIPVLPDLSDLVERIEWAIAHDAEAHAIQQAGQAFAERVMTDAQNDCYFSAVLLEWGRLQAWAKKGSV